MMRNKITLASFCIIIFLLITCCCELLFAGNYNITYWYVQKRTYEDGTYFNRLAFQVIDGSGSPVLADVVKSITFVGPNGLITLPPYDHQIDGTLSGNFNYTTSQWSYDSTFSTNSFYLMHFDGVLLPGQYTLTVVDNDDVTIYSGSKTFSGLVDLPQIYSDSFRGSEDSSGNLIWGWEPPSDTGFWNKNDATSVRAWVEIRNGNTYVGEVDVSLSSASGIMFVPADIMALAKAKGDSLSVGLLLRTNDNNNRYYTSVVPLSSLKPSTKCPDTSNKGGFFVIPIKVK